MDKRETDRFLHRIYDNGDEFEVLYLDGDGTVRRLTKTFRGEQNRDSNDFILEVERAEAAGFNVYVSAMPLAAQKAKAFDRIWVDQDDPAAENPFARSENPWPAPTTLVKTSDAEGGYRWQAIWRLQDTLPQTDARARMKRLAEEIGADGGVHDARRVLRLAGVMNAKRGSQARLMSTEDGLISIDAFGSMHATTDPLAAMLNATIQNPNHVLGEFLEGVEKGERNRKAYMAAKHLKNAAVGYDDAAAFLMLGASRCDPVMDDRELEHALNSAYHREV